MSEYFGESVIDLAITSMSLLEKRKRGAYESENYYRIQIKMAMNQSF